MKSYRHGAGDEGDAMSEVCIDGNTAALNAHMAEIDRNEPLQNSVEAYLHDEADEDMLGGEAFESWAQEDPAHFMPLLIAACGYPISPGLSAEERRAVRLAKISAAASQVREDYRAHVVGMAEASGRYDDLMDDAARGDL